MRLFFALLPTAAQSEALVAAVAPLAQSLEGQPMAASNIHATLCFVGTIEVERLDALRAAASRVRGLHVTLRFDALEVWEKPEILERLLDQGAMALLDVAALVGKYGRRPQRCAEQRQIRLPLHRALDEPRLRHEARDEVIELPGFDS